MLISVAFIMNVTVDIETKALPRRISVRSNAFINQNKCHYAIHRKASVGTNLVIATDETFGFNQICRESCD